MVLFALLCVILAGLLIFAVGAVFTEGFVFIALFGDVIVFALLIVMIVKIFGKKKKH